MNTEDIKTPRIDAATSDGLSGDAQATQPEVARQLERELFGAMEALRNVYTQRRNLLETRFDAARAVREIERMRK